MRHYEIVFIVHPDQSDQAPSIISKLSSIVTDSGGTVHRSENIGNRRLAYPIQDQFKASYALLNIECSQTAVEEIKNSFKFNDSVIRSLILNSEEAHTDDSALLNQTREDKVIKRLSSISTLNINYIKKLYNIIFEVSKYKQI